MGLHNIKMLQQHVKPLFINMEIIEHIFKNLIGVEILLETIGLKYGQAKLKPCFLVLHS